MSRTGSFPSAAESFERLEDFPAYTSCIRCFGKSIISPLLTSDQREEACRFRNAAAKLEADNVKKKKEHSSISDKDYVASCSNDDYVLHREHEEQNSALNTTSVLDFQSCPSNDATIFSNEMHISTCKIPSSDICSTVHKNVIVSPNVIQTNNDEGDLSLSDTKRPNSLTDLDGAHKVLDNVECSARQEQDTSAWVSTDGAHMPLDGACTVLDNAECSARQKQDTSAWVSAMPYESAPTEQMYSVSEDEPDSITESTGFGSLPTVIDAKQSLPQDTDNESNATCLTQSTDLEKYLDSSIDYSSPDDLARSQMSNNLNASSRSNDASSETIINTGSESTPCASSMAVPGYSDDCRSDIVPKIEFSVGLVVSSRRSHSVDSYMKMAGAGAEKSAIRKSQSEPPFSESTTCSEIGSLSNLLASEIPKTKSDVDDSQQEVTPVSDSEVSMEEVKKSLKRKHVRTNSYTLEHPSPALILAHADCDCREDSPNLSPHSCSSDKVIQSPPNLAFKKEKVNIVLPPASERDRYFPILSSTSVSMKKPDVSGHGDSVLGVGGEAEVHLSKDVSVNLHHEENMSQSTENLNTNAQQVENSSRESFEEYSERNNINSSTQDVVHQQITVSPVKPSDKKEFLDQVIREVKEIQKNRVNQFYEEQNKLWLRMQEEFKEQEILLCEKLKIIDISPFSDGAQPMPYDYSDVTIQQLSLTEQNIPKTNPHAVPHLSRNSNTGNNHLSVETAEKEAQEVDVFKKPHPPPCTSDTTNFETTESSNGNFHLSQSTTSTATTTEDPEIPPPLPERSSSLSTSHGSLQANSYDGYLAGSSVSVSSKSYSNTGSQSQNQNLDVLSDRLDFSMSETSVDSNIQTSDRRCFQSSVSSKSFGNSDRRSQNHVLSDKQDFSLSETSVHSNIKASESRSLQSKDSSKSFSDSDRQLPNHVLRNKQDFITPETSVANNIKISESRSLQSSESSKSFNNSDRWSQNHTLDMLRDRQVFNLPETSVYSNIKASESGSLQPSMCSEPYSNPDRPSQNHSLDVLSDRPQVFASRSETSGDGNFKASEIPVGSNIQSVSQMQSLYDSCPISAINVPYFLESNCSSAVSFRSGSGLSQASDVFRDFRFLNENRCPTCSSARQGNSCVCVSGSVCPKCSSCLTCFSFDRRGISYESLSDGGNRPFTTPISPSEFIPHPPYRMEDKHSTSATSSSLPVQNGGLTASALSFANNNISARETSSSSLPVHIHGANSSASSFKSNNISSSDINSSETSNSDKNLLLNNNLEPNAKQNMLIINTKNNLSDINTDISYSEEEIRAINDLVQSSYASSYPYPLKEDCSIMRNNCNKIPSPAGVVKSSSNVPSIEKGSPKQSISTSLTNLKRRQSRDIVKDPILLKKFEKLPALVKGYLTRRLFKTERVQDLIRTLQDTALLVGKFSQELKLKGNSVSENDVDLHRQLIAQLMKTFDSVYDIFCTTSIKEQMKIITESRNFRKKKKTTAKNESSSSVVSEKCRPSPSKKPKVSAATLKALERKRSCINSRTFTVEDFKSRKPKVHSTTTTKARAVSPSRIYKATVGTSLKRKTSVCKSSPWK